MTKLLITTGIYPPDIGGPATYVRTLQAELLRFGFEIRIVTYSNNNEAENGVYKISRKSNILLRYWQYFFTVYRLISWADIVYAQGPMGDGLPTWLASKIKNKNYILKIVGDYAWEQGKQRFGVEELLDDFQKKRYGPKVEIIRFLQKVVARSALLIITPSEYLKKIVGQWGVEVNKIKVVYNAVAIVKVLEDREKLRKRLGVKGDIICSAGRLQNWKGFDTLIKIMPNLLAVNPNFKLLIFGSGPEESNLRQIIDCLNLHERVKLMGSKPRAELMQYMSACDYFVLNTGYEGLPHLIIEAMQLGLPVIATTVGGNLEVVNDNKNGILVEYNNKEQLTRAIKELWQNAGKREVIIRNAKDAVSNFSQVKMVDGLIKILNETRTV
ncbi:MAG: N-acetylgalactosamine-N,N'-diacetylbacillosaminyl-diphospho-undecaprenol 4-alpha-N-acetylgalactosaminyltransferase [Parcubacteria group bacterium ADurb.Bin316]|nr:MAG: N-acetylgalactosamine-N,N'-diacetylbacillosaminyl-diphospho-undecaprenol 4-alpha-N-acetylgalactosaminyltransferase [Parcubacteria group bacterium ADurb.Bin316]